MLFLLCFDAGGERTLVASHMEKAKLKVLNFHVQYFER